MSNVLDVQTQKSFEYLLEVEEVAQDILTDKDEKLNIANAQNKYREAFRALEKVADRQSWIKIGTVYVQMPTSECKAILKENIESAESDIRNLEQRIKDNVCKLRDLEHEPGIIGIGLKPLSAKEAKAITKAFGVT